MPYVSIAIPFFRLEVERHDRHWWLTALALAALGIAVAMALFGLPPIDLHGPLHKFGIMDPLCGGTRAARYTAQGNLVQAWRYNPLSILIVGGAALAVLRTFVGLISRRWVTFGFAWTPQRRRWMIGAGLLLLVLLEIRQQMRADLLTAGTDMWR
ncbi:DUF2752 domain-containing protein [Nocardioides panzhihuensis]|jgi:hypothetical protein|uniref:DUF2752 domain-containing protein n=1 Tax=Nocardioides panzhihuensis TaxID=860243 RepID=A0A7Z0DKJ4_9ACTN|nr:DUF2752 domain-containing protein [Nocardioides panzhihuensis]NYI77037.1 hypothetical protein [Nocardioides panzhihuensis]